jgi:hypothetical protein
VPAPEIPVPKEIRDAVLYELYRQLGEVDWEDISDRKKTAYYSRWVEDPAIGGELADYYTAEGMRVWLKDGPLKEYARALENFGYYARYTTRQLSPPTEFIPEVLGTQWGIVPHSIDEKPMHCLVTDGVRQRYVCWGKPQKFRDLQWAAVNKALDSPHRPQIIVYLTDGKTVAPTLRRQYERIAAHCAIDLAYVPRTLTPRIPD